MSTSGYVRFFEDFGIDDVPLVGGKNASLGELFQKLAGQGVRVPHGFAITAAAYRYMLDEAGAWGRLHAELDGSASHDRQLVTGTGFTIEPGIYTKAFGVRTEINMVVGPKSADVTGPSEAIAL